jgi:hypothetical protein
MPQTPTVTKANESGFIFAINKNTKQVEKIAATAPVQIGRLDSPAELQLLGSLSLSSITASLRAGDLYNVPSQVSCINVKSTGGTGSIFIKLPINPLVGQIIIIKDENGSASTNNIIVSSQSSHLIDGSATKSITTAYGFLQLLWNSKDWAIISETSSGASAAPVNATYVVTSANATLTNEKVLTAGTNVSIATGASTVTISATGTSPAGSDTQVQFNDGGSSFGADVDFTYNKTSNLLTVGKSEIGTVNISATDYAVFAHKDATLSTGYALLQADPAGSANTWINAPTGGKVYIGNNDTAVGYLDNNEVSLTGQSGVATTTTIGNTAGASSTRIDAGTGTISIGTSNSSRTINIGSDPIATATTQQLINIGAKNTSGYNRIFIADDSSGFGHEVNIISHINGATQSSAYSLINIGTINALSLINIGTNAGGTAKKRVTIGSNYDDSYVVLRNGTQCITMPDQPTFLVTLSSSQLNISTSTDVKIEFNSEVFDTGSNFSTINYEFTAPVSGKYLFNVAIRVNEVDIDADYYTLYLVTSNRSYRLSLFDPGQFNADPQYWWLNGSTVADMDASDTAYVVVRQQAGVAQSDIVSGVSNSFFSGWLLG